MPLAGLLVEVKRQTESINDHLKQAIGYIAENNEIDYGFLTNGWEYAFLIQRDFIQRIANVGLPIDELPQNTKVLHAFSISIDEKISSDNEGTSEDFLKAIRMFSKDSYEDSFKQLANNILQCIQKKRGAKYILHHNRVINAYLQKKVSDKHEEKKGTLYPRIGSGEYSENDILYFEDELIRFEVLLTAKGKVVLEPASIDVKNNHTLMASPKYPNLLSKINEGWNAEKKEFEDYKDIFRTITERPYVQASKSWLKKK